MKKSKKILFAATLFSLSTIPVASISIVKSIRATEQDITRKSEDTQAVTNPDSKTVSFTLNKDYKNLTWYNKEFSNQVTEAQLKELLLPNFQFGVNYGILIETPTEDNGDLVNGYVNFAIYIRNNQISNGVPTVSDSSSTSFTFVAPPQNIKNNGKDGTETGIDMRAYPTGVSSDTPTDLINGVSVQKTNVWTTKNISNLFLPYKYSFSWNSNDKIGDFLEETNKQAPSSSSEVTQDGEDSTYLTAQDVYNNMIATTSQTDILPSDTVEKAIKISTTDSDLAKYGVTQENAIKYGVALVSVDFSNTSENKNESWASGSVPKDYYLVRGLENSSGNKEEMEINLQSNISSFLSTSLSVKKIQKQNPNFTVPQGITGDTIKVNQLTPTQLINALVTNSNGTSNLLGLLASKDYLSDQTNSLPAIYLSYMGSNQFKADETSSNPSTKAASTSATWGGTGLFQQGNIYSKIDGKYSDTKDKNAATSSQITAISASSNDSTGALYLKVTYNKYNVYENIEEMGLTTSFVISGMKSTSSTATNDLYLQWKTVDQLIFSSPTYVENLYNKYKPDSDYLKTLSNSFFLGSQNTYDLDRQVTIAKNGNNLTISLVFSNFGDCYYTDASGKVQSGLQVSNTFDLGSDQDASASGVSFTDKKQVQSTVSNYAAYTPQELINAISEGTVPITDFVKTYGNYSYSTVVMSNDTNDGIVVEVTATSNTRATTTSYKYSAIYDGLTTGASSSYIYNYAFSEESNTSLQDGLAVLRQIPFDQITPQNVLDYYVSRLPIYTGTYKIDFSVNDVTITKNSDYTITVQVVIPSYNSSDTSATTANRTFTTKLNGFLSQTKNNNNSNRDVKDLTVPLSVGFASAIVLIMGAILTHTIIKRKKLSKSKVNLKELRKNQKSYKK